VQLLAPPAAYVPAEQTEHAAAPAAEEVPAAHGAQSAPAAANVPAAQLLQLVAPAADDDPALQE